MSFSLQMGHVCEPLDSSMIPLSSLPLSSLFIGEVALSPTKAQPLGWVGEGPQQTAWCFMTSLPLL